MLTFTLTNRRFSVKEGVQTIMKQVLYTSFLGPSERLTQENDRNQISYLRRHNHSRKLCFPSLLPDSAF